jgi:hypothetical protein
MVNTAQQIGGAIGTAVFSSLATLTVTRYLGAHGAGHTSAATIAGYHVVFWVAAAVFLAAAVTAALLFRNGPLRRAGQGVSAALLEERLGS